MKVIAKKGWVKVKFGDVCKNINLTERTPLKNGIDRYIGLEHLESENLHIKSWGNVSDGTTFTKKFLKGHILFGKRRAYLKKAAIAEFDGICSGDILVFEANEKKIHKDLFPFLVSSDAFFDFAIKTSAGSLSPRTKFQDLANFEFFLPPKEQQEKLAALLWAGDKLIEMYNTQLLMLLKVKQSYERKELLKPIKKLGLPKGYQIKKLEEVAYISGGSTPSRNDIENWGGKIPWLTPTDVTKHDSVTISSTSDYITEKGLKSISNKIYPVGSILLCTRATIGAAVINEVEMATNQGFSNFICKPDISNYFLYFVLKHNVEELTSLAGGSTFPEISKSALRSFEIVIPPAYKQVEIQSTLLKFEELRQSLCSLIRKTKQIQKQLINQIFS